MKKAGSGGTTPSSIAIGLPGSPACPLPDYADTLCEIAQNARQTPAVVLLPDTQRAGELVSLLCARALAPAACRAPEELIQGIAKGSRVRVLPDEGVYEFDGLENGGFWLRLLDVKNFRSSGRMWAPMRDAGRLQPTTRKRPLGSTDRQAWSPLSPTLWDGFSGTHAGGNAALTRTAVVLVGSRTGFRAALERELGFAGTAGETARAVDMGLTWGEVDEDGSLHVLSPSGASGCPLIAVARDHVSARRLADSVDQCSLVIISTYADDALADRTSVESIAERHHLLVLAPGRLREPFKARQSAGWTVVDLSESAALGAQRTGIAPLDRMTAAAAWAQRRPGMLAERCPELETGFVALDAFGRAAAAHIDVDDDVAECDCRLREIFFEASDWLAAPCLEDLQDLHDTCAAISDRRRRLVSVAGEAAGAAAMEVTVAVRSFAERTRDLAITPKGECLLRLASAAADSAYRQVFVAGHGQTARTIEAFLKGVGVPVACVTPTELVKLPDIERVNVVSMMRREAFTRLVDPWPARNLLFLGYRHEVEVYERRLDARSRLIAQLRPAGEALLRFPRLDAYRAGWLPSAAAPPEPPEPMAAVARPARQPPASRPGDPVRPARFCRFAGRSWMAVTDDHGFARVHDSADQTTRIISILGRNLQVGDLLLIREGGEKDIVRETAEEIAGRERYATLRTEAALWRHTLRRSGLRPEELRERLAEWGLDRGLPTIRYWLSADGPIGPSDPDMALPLIAEALAEDPHAPGWKACAAAIHTVRGLHLEAGFRLTSLLLAECGQSVLEHSEHETPFELSLGTVWLLGVEGLEAHADWPAGQVNRIQWESESWRRKLMARGSKTDLPMISRENFFSRAEDEELVS